MSTYFADTEIAFLDRLDTLASVPPVAHENVVHDNVPDTLYLKTFMLPGDTVQASLGTDGKDESVGIFQISVYIPVGDGMSAWPDSIADHFKRGTTLTKNNVKLRIRSVSIASGFRDDNFYIVPVSIDYQVFTAARAA